MIEPDVYVIIRELQDEAGVNTYFQAYVFNESVIDLFNETQVVPGDWVNVFAARNEAALLSRVHDIYNNFFVEFSDGTTHGKPF